MQSCERSDSDLNSETFQENTKPVSLKTEKVEVKDANWSTAKDSDVADPDTGDDDEPRRDKQHWRIRKDTISNN
ncbi:hypothetical protein AR685_16600 [Chryseobacterium sp. JAH]|nr:hypothetical protein AR685_16600 [Chryseobacterium sp. JAH]